MLKCGYELSGQQLCQIRLQTRGIESKRQFHGVRHGRFKRRRGGCIPYHFLVELRPAGFRKAQPVIKPARATTLKHLQPQRLPGANNIFRESFANASDTQFQSYVPPAAAGSPSPKPGWVLTGVRTRPVPSSLIPVLTPAAFFIYTRGMESDLIKRLHAMRWTRGEVSALAAQLPLTDDACQQVIESRVAAADEAGVTALMLAMMAGGRNIEARMLPGVLPLMHHLDGVSAVALRARGEVVEALLTAVENGLMGWERQAVLLLIAGWICLKREPIRELPPNLISKARLLAREVRGRPEASLPLFALAHLTQNKALQTVLEEMVSPPPPEIIAIGLEFIIEKPVTAPLDFLPEQMDRVIHASGTLRRAVAKVGRNDPCPCGSGRKYKKCCFAGDQERLHHSSEVAGVTTEELEEMPEPFLTREKLQDMRGPKLARLRIEVVAPALQGVLIERLSMFQQTDALLAAWQKVGWRPDLLNAWDHCLFEAAKAGRRDVVARLVQLCRLPPEQQDIPLNAQLLLLQEQPDKFLQRVEEAAARHLREPGNLDFVDAACAFQEGPLPGLGTLVARGAAAVASPLDAEMLFECICKIRDRLNLPPEDPGEWMLDRI